MRHAPRIVVAPDSFKGTLTADEVVDAVADGIARVFPTAEVVRVPMADGGEGTVDAVVAAGFERRTSRVSGPLGDPIDAAWAVRGDTAVIEMAAAGGLPLVDPTPTTALEAHSFGTGELVRAALDAGARRIVLGIGGTATTDAGVGALRALGAVTRDARGAIVTGGGGGLADITTLDVSGLDPRLRTAQLVLCSDVANPFCGRGGAARVFAPQKGADASAVELLDTGLAAFAGVVHVVSGVDLVAEGWGGSGGGLAGTFFALLGAAPASGVDLMADLVGLDAQLIGADVAVVGEGSLDAQSLLGKAPVGVARRARAAGVGVVAVAGRRGVSPAQLEEAGIQDAATAVEVAGDVATALADPPRWVAAAAEAVMRRWAATTPS